MNASGAAVQTGSDSALEPALMLFSADGRIALGPLHVGLLPWLHRWFNDIEGDRTQGDLPGPRIRERVRRWLERVMSAEDMAFFAIYALDVHATPQVDAQVLQPIGTAWLSDINEHQRTCGFAISIGDAAMRGRGYGTLVTGMLLDYAFNALGLHHVSLEVYSNNPAGLRAYTRAGFRECGRLQQRYRHGQEVYDVILMECLQPWFRAVHPQTALQQAFTPDTPRGAAIHDAASAGPT